jgi:serine/threonine protein kinase
LSVSNLPSNLHDNTSYIDISKHILAARGPEIIVEWPTRMKIAIGITNGLSCLHNQENIVHGNLTSSNIQLDEQTIPHITDFGLSRLMTTSANICLITI